VTKPAKDTVAGQDSPWSYQKVRLLLDGEFLREDEDVVFSQTAYDMRRRAMDGYGLTDSAIEAIQLIRTIKKIKDVEVRQAMILRVVLGWDEYEIQLHLGSRRAGHHLLDRGSELVRRIEKTEWNAGKSARERERVCWRCMRNTVERGGEECEDCPGEEPVRRGRGNPNFQSQQGERLVPVSEWSLDKLIETQDLDDYLHMPGHTAYAKYVSPVEDIEGFSKTGGAWQDVPGGRRKRVMRPDYE
jgi:hypothetical protein